MERRSLMNESGAGLVPEQPLTARQRSLRAESVGASRTVRCKTPNAVGEAAHWQTNIRPIPATSPDIQVPIQLAALPWDLQNLGPTRGRGELQGHRVALVSVLSY
jgi:hypothetical protein